MSTTALTPTHHGGFFKAAASIVAAIAIPYASPIIAANIGFSGVIGSAIVGGALGALTAEVTGGDWRKGAAFGAIGGGIGGYNYQAPASAGAYGTGSISGGGLYPGGVGDVAVGPASAGAGGLSTAGVAGRPGLFAGATDTFTGGFDPSITTPAPALATPTGSFVPLPEVIQAGFPQGVARGTEQLIGGVSQPGASSINMFAPPAAAPTTPTTTGFFEDVGAGLSNFAGDVGKRISAGITPERVAEGLNQLAASAFAETAVDKAPVSPEEIRLRGIRDEARAEQRRLSGIQEEAAGDFLREARAINPVYSGQQALTEEQNRLARAQQAGLRRINPRDTGAVAAYQQQSALERSRLGGFARAYDARTLERERKLAQGIGLLPTGSELASGAAKDIKEADARYKRMQKQQVAAGGVFSTFLGDLGTDTEEERKKRGEGITAPIT